MGDRRMFSRVITTSDAFLKLPLDVRGLYFHLGEEADDDGFVGNPIAIAKNVGAKESFLKRLIDTNFVIKFPSGVIVITHWKIHNTIRSDRKKDTFYQHELKQLSTNIQGFYELLVDKIDNQIDNQNGNQDVNQNDSEVTTEMSTKMSAQIKLNKININKDKLEKEINKEKDSEPNVPSNHFLIDYLISNSYENASSLKSLNTWITESLVKRGEDKTRIDEICKSIITELSSMSKEDKENITNIVGHISMKISNGLRNKEK